MNVYVQEEFINISSLFFTTNCCTLNEQIMTSKDYLESIIHITKKLKLSPAPVSGQNEELEKQYLSTKRIGGVRRKVSTGTMLTDVPEHKDGPEKGSATMTMDEKLEYIQQCRKELQQKNQTLARQFLFIYKEIQRLKVRQSCLNHQDLLDEVFNLADEEKAIPNICDAPVVKRNKKTLQQCGVTRMNIHSKRFSCS